VKEITRFIQEDLLPEGYNHIPKVLTEFNFVNKGDKWVSTNSLKNTGEAGNAVGKVSISKDYPGYISDFREDPISIIDYLMRKNSTSFIETVEYLCSVCDLKLPNDPDFDPEKSKQYKTKIDVLEAAEKYFQDQLLTNQSEAAQKVREYLKGRGYTTEMIEYMGLGFLGSREHLFEHLSSKGFNVTEASKILNLYDSLGISYTLVIPWRSMGHLYGFKFRSVTGAEPKYLNSKDLKTGSCFSNLKPCYKNKDIIIVEGEFDALHASYYGVENVVSSGGNNLKEEQVRSALRMGAESFTICYDNDGPEDADRQEKKVQSAIRTILKVSPKTKVYVANIPDEGENHGS